MGIARNRIIDNVRSEKRHSDRRADEDTVELSTEAEVDAMSDKMLIADALRELPDRARRVITLAYLHDLTHPQIAERTNIPLEPSRATSVVALPGSDATWRTSMTDGNLNLTKTKLASALSCAR